MYLQYMTFRLCHYPAKNFYFIEISLSNLVIFLQHHLSLISMMSIIFPSMTFSINKQKVNGRKKCQKVFFDVVADLPERIF